MNWRFLRRKARELTQVVVTYIGKQLNSLVNQITSIYLRATVIVD